MTGISNVAMGRDQHYGICAKWKRVGRMTWNALLYFGSGGSSSSSSDWRRKRGERIQEAKRGCASFVDARGKEFRLSSIACCKASSVTRGPLEKMTTPHSEPRFANAWETIRSRRSLSICSSVTTVALGFLADPSCRTVKRCWTLAFSCGVRATAES